jgi:hypothetical protein
MSTLELPSNLEDEKEAAARPAVVFTLPRRVRIMLEENDNIPPTGQFFGVNGRTYMLRPGVPVDVPPELVDVLDHAIESVPVLESGTKRVIGHRSKHRYPYRRMGAGDAAW